MGVRDLADAPHPHPRLRRDLPTRGRFASASPPTLSTLFTVWRAGETRGSPRQKKGLCPPLSIPLPVKRVILPSGERNEGFSALDARQREIRTLRYELLGIVAVLWKMAGLGFTLVIPRSIHRAVTRLLRPAEAATRRLILVLAHALDITLPPPRIATTTRKASRPAAWRPFALADPARGWPNAGQRAFKGIGAPKGGEIHAGRLADRLDALCHALDDLDAQARRMARWQALRRRARARGAFVSLRPLRPGLPVDLRGRAGRRLAGHPLKDLLATAHDCAGALPAVPDTS